MMNGKRAALVIFGVTVGLAGCNGGTPPTAPSTVQPPPPVQTGGGPPGVLSDYTLSGMVFEMTPTGRMPIEGVEVYCEPCGAETHTWSTTDANGFYSFAGVWNAGVSPTLLFVHKDGYTDPVGVVMTPPNQQALGWRDVIVTGDTQFDIELVRR
jgi:hypothetical protein